jgi:hypothetical protein
MNVAERLIARRISVSTYILASASLALGVLGLIGSADPDTTGSPFAQKLAIDLLPWSILLTLGSIIVIVGLKRRLKWPVLVGSLTSFIMWLFATISFGITGDMDTSIVVGVPQVVFFAYLYIAAWIGVFDD